MSSVLPSVYSQKATRFGIKVWVNSEAKTGYVLCFQVYTGATGNGKSGGLGYRVVMDLMESYRMKGHCLFIDNFYTSPKLLRDLLLAGTYCTGTIKANRKNFPKEVIPNESNLPSGTMRFAISKLIGDLAKMIAVWWRNRRDVLALSTMYNTSVTTVLKHSKGGREKRPLPCPTIIDDYNQYMGGVDLTDQNLSYYSMTTRRTLKWWKKVFWRFVDSQFMDNFSLHNPQSPIKTQRLFRLRLIEELVQPLLDLRSNPDCPPFLQDKRTNVTVSTEKRLNVRHFAYKNPKRGRCRVCSWKKNTATGKKKDTKTQNFCHKCQVFLCVGQCFEDFPTKSSY